MIWTHLNKFRDLGLLLLRVTFGLYMALGHGWGKIAGGPEQWAGLGGTMEIFGLGFAPTFWGFMAAFAEFACALLVVLGLLTRPAALLLVINMAVAATAHITGAIDGGPEMALLYAFVFLSLILIGPGKYSVDEIAG
ncbi:MAG: DoxX family protein [Bacteroidetes bacterium QH_6_64_77]|nr:MAG: DoxX family protein [Bacteroidetes bacterium QH_1_64_81]PSQ72854.1 MAG: DoxX family protein [Bacteroidetes bacterium QH_6_64_77]